MLQSLQDVTRTARFDFKRLPIDGLWLAQQKVIDDQRGFFSRFYCADEFAAIGLRDGLVQINHSLSTACGTIRGLHFQHPPYAETKIVTCMRGRIYDVVVDIRRGSPSFLQWFGLELSQDSHASLIIPPGFAHGYQTLEEDSEILYLVTQVYAPTAEDGLNPLDPAIAIEWPIVVGELSQRDKMRPMIDKAGYSGLEVME